MKKMEHGLLYSKNLILGIMFLLLILEAIELLSKGHSLVIGWSLVLFALIIIIATYCKFNMMDKKLESKKIMSRKSKIEKLIMLISINNIPLLFIFCRFAIILVGTSMYLELTIIKINLSLWIIGYFIFFFFTYFLHFFIYRLTLKKLEVKSIHLEKSIFKYLLKNKKLIILGIISPDYMFAYLYKEVLDDNYDKDFCEIRKKKYYHDYKAQKIKCELIGERYECEIHEKKKKRKLFIIYSNWANLIVTSYFTLFAIFNLYEDFIPKYFIDLVIVIIITRTLSRVIEIIYAFYNDVVSPSMSSNLEFGERTSNLKRGNRISLAIHSYVEVTLLFALIYHLLKTTFEGSNEEYINTILYSFSVSAFNVSFPESLYTFENFFHVVQIGTSMTLVILALASYLGIQDEMNKYEKIDWNNNKYI